MQPPTQTVTSTAPRVFRHSLDWRFLLPIADLHKAYFLFEEDLQLSQALEHVGIHASQRLSFSDLRNLGKDKIPFLVLPFGLSRSWVGTRSADRVEFYVFVRSILETRGTLLVGFNNRLNWGVEPESKYYSSGPHRFTNELKQAGFPSVEIFGAMPDLQIPEYIFELDPRTLRFALQTRFRRKPTVLRALRILSGALGWRSLSGFLPCYFAVATA